MTAGPTSDMTDGAMSVRGNACLAAKSPRPLAIAYPAIRLVGGHAGTWSGG